MRYSQKRAHAACVLIAIAINLFSFQLSFGQSPGGVSSGLIWWLKADADVLTAESGPAAADGDKLYKWLDKSSTAVHAYSQNNGVPSQDWRPTFKTNIINGNPVVRFAKNHFISRSSSSAVGHVFMVFKHNSAPASTGTATDENGAYIVDRSSIGAGSRFSLKIANTDKYCIQKQNNSGSTNSFTTSTTTATTGSFRILDYYLNTGASQFGVGLNGAAHETGTGTSDNTFQNPFKFGLHQSNATDSGLDGDLAELVVYNSNPTSTERLRIESYLAIKYGITLNQSTATNYIASDGTTVVYPATTTHDSYDIDIAGIAKDDGSGLNQTSSQSQNTNSIVKVSNPSSLANGDFLVWGANSSALTVSSSVGYPYRRRLTRAWRAAETNDVGTVTISFDLTGTGIDMSEAIDFALLIDSDGDFTSGATAHTTGRTVNTSTNTVTFTTASINNNDYFTLTTDIIPGPGWVINNLRWWMRADKEVLNNSLASASDNDAVAQWNDQSQIVNNATQGTSTIRPIYKTSIINSNPVLRFSTTHYLDALTSPGITNNCHFFAVFKFNSASGGNMTDGSGTYLIDRNPSGGGTPVLSLKVVNTNKYGFQKRDDTGDIRGPATSVSVNTTSFTIVDYYRNITTPSTALGIGLNGAAYTTIADVTNNITADKIRFAGNGSGFDGDFAEFVVYNANLTSTERQQVESYLGIKYGITIDQTTPTNYLSASGTVVYPAASTHDSYDQDIAGIAKDDYCKLNQTSGKSQNSGNIVTISSPSSLEHDDYLLWGHNGGSATVANETDVPAPYGSRLARVWRAAETNDVGTVTISFDLSATGVSVSRAADFALLIDSDGTFSNATIHTIGRSINGSVVTFTTASINNNDYFTIATSSAAPGGVSNNLRWWLKADAGVVTNASNFVTQWNDQSGIGNNATQTGADALRPTYQTSIINGNPVLRFSGNQYVDAGSAPGISSNAHFFAVLKFSSVPSSGGLSDGSGAYIIDRTTNSTPLVSLKIVNTNKNYGFQKRDNASDLRGVASTDAASTSAFAIVDYFRNTATPALGIGVNGRTQATNSDVTNGLTADPIRVGRHSTTASSGINGDLAEFVVFSESLTSAERQQVESYLGIKYGITVDQATPTNYLSASGSVVYPAASTHDSYDQDIAGIAKDNYSKLNQTSGKSQNSGNMITVSNPSSLENGDYLLWGHDNGSITSPNDTDVTGIIQRRMSRVWKIAETNEAGTVDIEIDLTNVPGNKQQADLRLLIDRDNDGFNDNDVTPLTGTLTGQIFKVTGVNFSNGDKFTIGTTNTNTTPLPISLLEFSVQPSGMSAVDARWTTSREINNDYFTLERSSDGIDFLEALHLSGAGNSNEEKHYHAVDNAPYSGRSYYRLKQTDFDGKSTYSDVKTVKLVLESSLFPNPNEGDEFSLSVNVKRSRIIQIDILNASGLVMHSETQPASREGMQTFKIHPNTRLQAGLYYAKVKCDGEETGFKFIVR